MTTQEVTSWDSQVETHKLRLASNESPVMSLNMWTCDTQTDLANSLLCASISDIGQGSDTFELHSQILRTSVLLQASILQTDRLLFSKERKSEICYLFWPNAGISSGERPVRLIAGGWQICATNCIAEKQTDRRSVPPSACRPNALGSEKIFGFYLTAFKFLKSDVRRAV